MPELHLYNREGSRIGAVPVPSVLEGPANTAVLWQAVRMYLANRRQGTADTKLRGEVRGGGKKPWKQKHTGRARAGSIRSPLWRKGGIVFGPHPREYRYQMPDQMRRLALVHSLKVKVGDQSLSVVENLEGWEPKSKSLAKFLSTLEAVNGALLVVDRPSPLLARMARNLPRVQVLPASDLNCYDVLGSSKLVVTAQALKQLEGLVR